MKHQSEATKANTQLEQLAKELDTIEGCKRLAEEAYHEALLAEKYQTISPNKKRH